MRSARENCLVTLRRPWKVPFNLLACTIRAFGRGLTVLRLSKEAIDDEEEEEKEDEEEAENDDEDTGKDTADEEEDESSKLREGTIDIQFFPTGSSNFRIHIPSRDCFQQIRIFQQL
jgi:hypothetical protein